jgi:hypothetical protein
LADGFAQPGAADRRRLGEQRPLVTRRRAEGFYAQAQGVGRRGKLREATDEREAHPARVRQRLPERELRAPGAAAHERGREHDGADRTAAALRPGEHAVYEHAEGALELLAERRLRQLEHLLQALAGNARAQGRVAAEREVARKQTGFAEAIGQRVPGQLGQLAQGRDPEALQRLRQRRDLRASGQQ